MSETLTRFNTTIPSVGEKPWTLNTALQAIDENAVIQNQENTYTDKNIFNGEVEINGVTSGTAITTTGQANKLVKTTATGAISTANRIDSVFSSGHPSDSFTSVIARNQLTAGDNYINPGQEFEIDLGELGINNSFAVNTGAPYRMRNIFKTGRGVVGADCEFIQQSRRKGSPDTYSNLSVLNLRTGGFTRNGVSTIKVTNASALDVQDAGGTSVFKVDTTNGRSISTREATLLTEAYSFATPAIADNATLRISCDLIPSTVSNVKFFEIELNFLSRQSGSTPQILISKKFIGWFYLGDVVNNSSSAVVVSSINALLTDVKFELNSAASDNDTLIIDIFNDNTGRNIAAGFCSVKGTGIKNVQSLGIV